MAENKLVTGVISPYLKLGYNFTYNWFQGPPWSNYQTWWTPKDSGQISSRPIDRREREFPQMMVKQSGNLLQSLRNIQV